MIRGSAVGLIVMLGCIPAQAADVQAAIYDEDVGHLWNRLYRAVAVRTEAGITYGVDSSLPIDEDFDDPDGLASVLDEFLRTDGQTRISNDLKHALLLHDVWTAFDLAAHGERMGLTLRLARVVGKLRMSDRAIAGLKDNYGQAVNSGRFGNDFDPAHPEKAFLPPDLFDMNGPWVEIGESGLGLVAPTHVAELSGRSSFRIFIRCPEGRDPTLAYLNRLNLHRTPWAFVPAEIGIEDPSGRRTRWDPRLDPATPQFPEGTIVALVRQMAVINSAFEPVLSPITQTLQFRVYRKVGASGYVSPGSSFVDAQFVYEIAMRRRDLLAGKSGGLHQVDPEDTEYAKLNGSRATRLRGSVVLEECARCHGGNGIFSVNSYTRGLGPMTINPRLLPADNGGYQALATKAWKKRQFDWGLLRGLLDAGR